ncbi:MAG: hypothetical protein ACOCV0_00075 [Alkalispirochaeta sp.]
MSSLDGVGQSRSRVFRIDEECYVLYMGSEERGVRPFLRIGTSRFLPEQIKRHIGSVVITDHLTGDFTLEADSLDARTHHGTRYVGTRDVVNAIKGYVHDEKIPYQELEPVQEERPGEGGQVLFFENGNIRIFLDGHRLFDLNERERHDRHRVFRLRRINDIVTASRGSYRSRDFEGSGFVVDDDYSVLTFSGGTLFLNRELGDGGLHRWAHWGIPISLVVGPEHPEFSPGILDLYKYRITEGIAIPDFSAGGGRRNTVSDEFGIFAATGCPVKRFPQPQRPPEAPVPGRDGSWELPEGASWHGDGAPPLLPGIVYRYDEYASDREFRDLLSGALRRRVDDAKDPDEVLVAIVKDETADHIDRSCAALWLWNRRAVAGTTGTGKDNRLGETAELLRRAFSRYHVPTVAVLRREDDRWHLVFRPRGELTRSAVAENDRAREKLQPFLELRHDTTEFERERSRLAAYLQELLDAQRVVPRAPRPTTDPDAKKAPTESPPDDDATPERTATDTTSGSTVPEEVAATAAAGSTPSEGGTGAHNARSTAGRATSSAPAGQAGPGDRVAPRRPSGTVVLVAVLVVGVALVALLLVPAISRRERLTTRSGSTEIQAVEESSPDDARGNDVPDSTDATDTGSSGDGADTTEGDALTTTDDSPGASDGAEREEASGDSSGEQTERDSPDGSGDSTVEGGNFAEGSSDPRDLDSEWTILDVLRVTNWIARENGYREIGVAEFSTRPDPDWIFPGNTFRLPDGDIHQVSAGETLWSISAQFLSEIFLATHMELSRFRDLINSTEYPVEVLEQYRKN